MDTSLYLAQRFYGTTEPYYQDDSRNFLCSRDTLRRCMDDCIFVYIILFQMLENCLLTMRLH